MKKTHILVFGDFYGLNINATFYDIPPAVEFIKKMKALGIKLKKV